MDLSGLDLSNLWELEVQSVGSEASHQLKYHLCVRGQSQQLSSRDLTPLNGKFIA